MKQILFTVLCGLLIYNVGAQNVTAVSPSGHTLYYSITDGNAQVVGSNSYTNISGNLIIPEILVVNSINIPVVSIAASAFRFCEGLTAVTLPNSITILGDEAFSLCSNLTSINLPIGITSIGELTFSSTNLDTIILPDSLVSIGYLAFYNCNNLKKIIFPNTITTIGPSAFMNCYNLETVIVPNTVTSIGGAAFASVNNIVYHGSATGSPWGAKTVNGVVDSCFVYLDDTRTMLTGYYTGIENIEIPNSVNTIGPNAFYGGIVSITIPSSVTQFGNNAFGNCSIARTNYLGTVEQWCNINFEGFASNPVTKSGNLYIDDTLITDLVISNEITEIKPYVFYGCAEIHSVIINAPITTFGESAFTNSGVVSVIFGKRVKTIGEESFYGCSGLSYVDIGDSVTTIGSWAFHYCGNLTTMIVRPVNPPTFVHFLFGVPAELRIYVQCSSLNDYGNAWHHNNYNTPSIWTLLDCSYLFDYNVDVNENDNSMGMANHTVISDSTVIIQATPYYGYCFNHWSNGKIFNPDTLLLSSDSTITAFFCKNQYTILTTTNDSTKGTTIGGQIANYLDSITITAIPNYGYHFIRWNDNNTDNPRAIIVTQNKTYKAFFSFNQYAITVQPDTNIHGHCTGDGNFNYLTVRTIAAIPNHGYHFATWSDGETNNPRTITLTQDTVFLAQFAKNNYTITAISADSIKGSVIGSTSIEYLDSVTIVAIPNYGYHFTEWNDGNTDNPRIIVTTKDSLFTASFGINQYTITLNVDTNIHGSVVGDGAYNYLSELTITATANYGYHFTAWSDGDHNNPRTITLTQDTIFTALFAKNTYAITAISADTVKGSVTGSTSIEYLDSMTIVAIPNYGYHFTAWNDGNTDNPRTIVATRDSVFAASFGYNQYAITLNVDTDIHGSVIGDGAYNYLSEQTITAMANYGYHFTGWSDGDTNNPRTITLTQDTIFTALFAKNTYAITAISADTVKGSVTGSTSIEYLDSVTIVAIPNYGYHFTAWNDGNTDNPRTIVATRDSVFAASFGYNQYTIALYVDTDIYGAVIGDGSYNYLSEQTITAMANYGYHFTGWSDGDTNNPRIIILTQDTAFTALFAKNQYTLTLQSDDVAHGGVIGGGVFEYLDTVAIEATSVEHYHFVQWNDGNTDNPRQYVITRDDTIIATFAIDTHHVSVESCNIAFGSVGGSGDFEYGTPATVTATGYSGYQFVRWSDGSTYNPYTFAVLHDTTLVAIFEAETQGIDDAFPDAVNVYAIGSQIVVVTELKDEISIYDIVGRKVDGGRKTYFDVPASGVYLIKIGTLPTQKVVVVK